MARVFSSAITLASADSEDADKVWALLPTLAKSVDCVRGDEAAALGEMPPDTWSTSAKAETCCPCVKRIKAAQSTLAQHERGRNILPLVAIKATGRRTAA